MADTFTSCRSPRAASEGPGTRPGPAEGDDVPEAALAKPPAAEAPEAARIVLAPILDLPQAGDLRDAIMAAGDGAITVDACQVEVIGTLAQQVLLSAARTWRARGRAFSIMAASPAFLACTRTLGLDFTPFLEGAEE